MLDADYFLEKLEKLAAGHARVTIDQAWTAFAHAYPHQAVTITARTRLLEILKSLETTGRIRLPKGLKTGWDHGTTPSLPNWLEIHRPDTEADEPKMAEIAWPPELAFAANLPTRTHLKALLRIREWLAVGGRKARGVPLKERSVEIFGDEKRLDQLLKTDLFSPGCLKLEALRCYPVYPDLIWERGSPAAQSILIIENWNTYHSFCKWNRESNAYTACVYGNGFMIHHTYFNLPRVLEETKQSAGIAYFGDLDGIGVRIGQELGFYLEKIGLPTARPEEALYIRLLDLFEVVRPRLPKKGPGNWTEDELQWFSPQLAKRVAILFNLGYRLPQEFIGTDYLRQHTRTTLA